MMKGLPYSGKTTWAIEWANAQSNRVRVSWSDMMEMLGGNKYRRDRLPIAFDMMLRGMCMSLRHGYDVVVDECNLNGLEVGVILARAQQCGAKIEWHTMETDVEECKRRARAAGSRLSDMYIDRLAERWSLWLKQR